MHVKTRNNKMEMLNFTPWLWFGLLATILLSILCSPIATADPINSISAYDPVSSSDMNNYIDDSIATFKLQLRKSSLQKKSRVRRSITIEDFLQPAPTVFESQISKIKPFQSVPSIHPVELEPFKLDGQQYLAVVNYKDLANNYETNSEIYLFNETLGFTLLQTFKTSGGIDFEFADVGVNKYAIFLDHVGQNLYGGNSETYEKWFQINQFLPASNEKKPFHYRTKVRALGAKKVKVLVKENKFPYFITANSFYESGNQYHVKSTMHFQTPFGYELVQSFETQGAQDVEIFRIDGLWYLVFANHRDNSGKVDIYSYIYREIPRVYRNPFSLFQRLETHGARDFEYFSFDGHHYLVVANEYTNVYTLNANSGRKATIPVYDIDSVIYWWTGKMFVEWQRIPTSGAVRWSYFTSDIGHPMLVVSNSKTQAVIYTFDPLRGFFKPTNVQGLSPYPDQQSFIPDVRSVMAFNFNNKTYFAVANYNETSREGTNIFEIEFSRSPVPKLDPSVPEIISSLLVKMKEELEEVKKRLTKVLLHVTKNVMTKSTDQNVTSKMTFQNIKINDTLITDNLLYLKNVSVNPVEDMAQQAIQLKQELHKQKENIASLQVKFESAVKLYEDTKITGKKTFSTPVSFVSNMTTNSLVVNKLIDNVNITQLDARAWKKSKDQQLSGAYTFTANTTMDGDVTLKGLLNNKNTSDAFLTATDQTVTGRLTFGDNLVFGSDVSSNATAINGLLFPNDVVTRHTDEVKSEKWFTKAFNATDSVSINGLIDNVDISDFDASRLTLTTNQTVMSKTNFFKGFQAGSDLLVDNLVDGVNLAGLKSDLDMAGKAQNISGSKIFKSIRILGSSSFSTINNKSMADIALLHEDQLISTEWTIANCSIKGNLNTSSTIDQVDVSTEVVTLHGSQTVYGVKTFNEKLHFKNNIKLSGVVNQVNLTKWKANAVLKSYKGVISGRKSFLNGVEVKTNMQVKKLRHANATIINPLSNLVSIRENGTWPSNIVFTSASVQSVSVKGLVNGIKISDDLVSLSSSQSISGQKVFQNQTNANEVVSNKNLNREDFSHIYDNALLTSSNQTLSGNVVFNKDVYFEQHIHLQGTLNNVSIPADIITINTAQNITATLKFIEKTTFEQELNTGSVNVSSTVNNIDISDMEASAIYKDRNQTLNGSIIFVSGFTCKRNLSVAGLINGVNLTELMNSTVRVSKDQSVYGRKIFNTDVKFNAPITTPGEINNIDLRKLNSDVLKTTSNLVFPSNFTIKGNVYMNETTLSNTSFINQINFTDYVNNYANRSSFTSVDGNLFYLNKLRATNLTTTTLNKISIPSIFTTSTNQTMAGAQVFASAAVKDLTLEGLLNNVNFTHFKENTLKVNGSQNITASYLFTNSINVIGDTSVIGYINGVNLTALNDNAVHLHLDEVITGVKTFTNVTFGNVSFSSHLNNIDISMLLSDALLANEKQNICQKKEFLNDVIVNGDAYFSGVQLSGLLNGIDINELSKRAVWLNETRTLNGSYYFNDEVEVFNLNVSLSINDLNIPQDFMLTYSNQTVDGFKFFGEPIFGSHVSVDGFVDGTNITNVDKTRFSLSSNQTVQTLLEFSNVYTESEVLFPGNATVNGYDISEQLVNKDENTIITGFKSFSNVLLKSNLDVATGLVNKVNLTDLNENALLLNSGKLQSLVLDQIFSNSLTIDGSLNVTGLINGMNVGAVGNYTDDVGNDIKVALNALQLQADSLCSVTSDLMTVTSTKTVLQGIEKADVVTLDETSLGTIQSLIIEQHVYISIARAPFSGCGLAYILKCSLTLQCDVFQTILTNSKTLEFFDYDVGGSIIKALFVAHWKPDLNETTSTCPENPEIYVWSSTLLKFIAYQSINEEVLSSEVAPVIYSNSILESYVGKSYNKYKKSLNETKNNNVNPFADSTGKIKWYQNSKKENYLVVAGNDHEAEEGFVDVLHVSGLNVSSIKKKQRIKTQKPKHVSVGKLKSGKEVLSISSGNYKKDTKVYVMNEKTKKFEFLQKLNDPATSIKIRSIKDQTYLVYASPFKGLGLCEWQGVSGFQQCKTVQMTNTEQVETVITDYGVFTFAGIKNKLVIYKSVFEGNQADYADNIC